MSANNLCIRVADAAIRWYRTRSNGHCLYLALFEPYGQQLSDAQIWAARRLLSDRVRAMSTLPRQSGQRIAVQIRQEHNESLDEYCDRMATTGAFGSTVEAEAFVKEKDGELSVRIWKKETFEGHEVLREMVHFKGNDDASVVELLWMDGGDAATGTDGCDHYERFDFQRVRRPPPPPPPPPLFVVFPASTEDDLRRPRLVRQHTGRFSDSPNEQKGSPQVLVALARISEPPAEHFVVKYMGDVVDDRGNVVFQADHQEVERLNCREAKNGLDLLPVDHRIKCRVGNVLRRAKRGAF